MQKELTEYFQDPHAGPGLLLGKAPTGYGKTFQAVQAIYAYLKQGGRSRILFVTPLLKNLPVDALRQVYQQDGREKDFDKEVLVLRSPADTVLNAMETQTVPEEFQTEAFLALEKACRRYKRYRTQPGDAAAELARELQDSIRTELEPAFRHELEDRLRRAFPDGAQARRNAIRTQKQYQWIAAFYPAVFWSDYKVLLLSVKKLMARNVPVVEHSFDCLSDRMLLGSILCIDEFDASRADILDSLIDKSLNLRADYLQLFIQVYHGIQMHRANRSLTELRNLYEKGRSMTWEKLSQNAEDIYQSGALQYSMKTMTDSSSRGRNFLFHDSSYLTVLDGKRTHIRAVCNDAQSQVQIYFDTPETYAAHKNGSRIVLQTLLRNIHVFLLRFQRYVYGWADAYAKQINASRQPSDDRCSVSEAAESIFREYGLTDDQVHLMTADLTVGERTAHPLATPDLSFYETGFRLFEFIDDDRHRTQTRLQYLQLQNTPEKVLLHICRRAKVVGLSATCDQHTVLGNYDLRYLREQLGEHFRTISPKTQGAIRREMEALWAPYRDGRVRVNLAVLDRDGLSTEDRLQELFGPGYLSKRYSNQFSLMGGQEYEAKRYCNLFAAMKAFWFHEEIHAFLCLNQLLPEVGKTSLDESLLCNALEDLRQKFAPESQGKMVVLRSGNSFERDKDALLNALGDGERRFILSSYQTLGAGQNLQYPVKDRTGLICLNDQADPSDKRLSCKDVDALYLGDITHVTVNLQDSDHWSSADLMRYCFQMECLYQNDEISCRTLQRLLKSGIGHFSRKAGNDISAQARLKHCPSFTGKVSRDVIQAVGRIGRTFLKRPTIYLYTTNDLLKKLDAKELDGQLLSPEMEALAKVRRALQAEGRTADRAHLEAERLATRGNAYLMRMLSAPWTEESMALWKQLRHTVLCHPRATLAQHQADAILRTYYLPISSHQPRYYFAQKGDFSEVRLSPGTDRAAFAAALQQEHFSAEPSEVSEEEARLPVLLSYPGMREEFEARGWAVEFGDGPYMLSPVLFQNIYKGALGEVAGAYILRKELGLALQEIDDPACFERFDFAGPDGFWFDFKHWKSSTRQPEEEIRAKTLEKLDAVGGRRAFLINLIAGPEFAPSCTADGRLVEIPGLLFSDGSVNRRALQFLGRYL
ncbi:DEAD/DEAH box helicase family protein [uncultured Gemmiger sp.]|uniref:DEAD/DEAH box helicase family protein n=1 Tax=uncultured Gemmiger sp. TaxID=1623490 RepID=UPI0025CD28A2|nr:DEAD/DEAH box helicase family protein [uncultured Gemmiger sp.]